MSAQGPAGSDVGQLGALQLTLRAIEGEPEEFARRHVEHLIERDPQAAAGVTMAAVAMLAEAIDVAAARDDVRPKILLETAVLLCEQRGHVDIRTLL